MPCFTYDVILFLLQVITKHRISHQRYDCIVNRIQKGGTNIDFDNDPTQRRSKSVRSNVSDDQAGAVGDGVRKFVVSAETLQKVGFILFVFVYWLFTAEFYSKCLFFQ